MQRGFRLLFTLLGLPGLLLVLLLYRLQAVDYASASQLLSLAPQAFGGVLLRRLWYRWTLKHCGARLVVEWLSYIHQPDSELGNNVYIGPHCSIGLVSMHNDILIADNTQIISGTRQHSLLNNGIPMRKQLGGGRVRINLGSDIWIGSSCVIGAAVPDGTVVAAGAVVIHNLEKSYSIYGGVPARLLSPRPEPATIAEQTPDMHYQIYAIAE